MTALLELLLGNIEASRNMLKGILELDLDLTDQHFHNPLYYYLDELLWSNNIIKIFEIKNFDWESDPSLLAIYGFLNFKTGNQQEGKEYINTALNLDKNNREIQILSAYVDYKLGFQEQLCRGNPLFRQQETVLKQHERHEHHLAFLLEERLCTDKNNVEGRKALLTKLQLSDHFQLQALTGLADVSEREQKRRTAKEYVQKAYNLSKNYKPLLEIQAKWARETNTKTHTTSIKN